MTMPRNIEDIRKLLIGMSDEMRNMTAVLAELRDLNSPTVNKYRNNSPVSYTDPLFLPPTLTSPTAKVLSTANRTAAVTTTTDMTIIGSGIIDGPVVIRDARRATGIGLHVIISGQIPTFAPGNTTAIAAQRGIAVNGFTDICYLEGCYIQGSAGMSEVFQLLGGPNCKLVCVNCRFEGAKSFQGDAETYASQHPDDMQALQCLGIYMRNCSIVDSTYQGFYATADSGPIQNVYLENVNIVGVRRQPFWINNPGSATLPVVKRFNNVWNMQYFSTDASPSVRPPFSGGYGTDHKNYSYNDNESYPYNVFAGHSLTGTRFAGEVIINDTKFVTGAKLLRGIPPDGDYAPADRVGTNYDAAWFEAQYKLRET